MIVTLSVTLSVDDDGEVGLLSSGEAALDAVRIALHQAQESGFIHEYGDSLSIKVCGVTLEDVSG